MKEVQSLHEKHPWSLLNDLSEQIDREAKEKYQNSKNLFFCPQEAIFLFRKSSNWQRVQVEEKILGIVNFYSFETRHFKKGWRAKILKNVSAEINSDVGEIFCGHLGQIPFTRRARGEIWKLCRSAWILILHEGAAPPLRKATRCFLDSVWLIGLILDSDWL